MLHHVALEVAPDQLPASLEFWLALGFVRVEAPTSIRVEAVWVERSGTQIHLLKATKPTVPEAGHVAVTVADFDATVARLEAAGIAVERRQEHWGESRAFATAPGGHRVELMAAAPRALSRLTPLT